MMFQTDFEVFMLSIDGSIASTISYLTEVISSMMKIVNFQDNDSVFHTVCKNLNPQLLNGLKE
jgi:hypothetical protein